MKYIGVRSCTCLPENDGYMGSSKILNEAMEVEPEAFTKTIIETFSTREIASIDEQRLHEMYDVARNSEFYNQMNAPLGFNGFGGMKHSDETKKKLGESQRGRKHSEETKKKMSDSMLGEKHHYYGNTLSEEHKTKIRNSLLGEKNHFYGKKHSSETRKKLSDATSGEKNYFYGKSLSEDHKKKISESKKGEKNCWYGKSFSEEHRKNMSIARKGIPQEKITCPHCQKTGGISAMKRYHFDNCREIA